jgi:protein-S-isoprenylcysteine O-methyltransferase Ste14
MFSRLLVQASWVGMTVSLALFLAGTELRVCTEEQLLAARFPGEFGAYRRQVPAYIPFVR